MWQLVPNIWSLTLYLLASSLVVFFISKITARSKEKLPYPPGPKGLPVLGVVLDIPNKYPWLKYDEWLQEYGDIVSFTALGNRFVILGSMTRVNDLFEARSSLYSSRPQMIMVNEMMRWDFVMSFLPYGSLWRRHRRMFHNHFHPNVVQKYIPTQTREIHEFLFRLLESPEHYVDHIRQTFAATAMDIAYGIRVKSIDDIYIKTIEEAMYGVGLAAIPGSFFVDLIPALKYIPTWVPGIKFKRFAEYYRQINLKMECMPWDFVKQSMLEGTAVPCVSTNLIHALPDESDPRYEEEEKAARGTVAVVYAGGGDTTLSAVQTFFLAMVLYPEVQKRAQQEIDANIGRNRLPEYVDKDAMPYTSAIVKETMRWQPVAPLGVAHTVTQNDIYDGYFIPKGTIILGNSWSILHDPKAYPEPEEFRPERFLKDGKLDPKVRDPNVAAFGYGRRICPGRHFSDNSLFIMISTVLAVFDIKHARDIDGNIIEVKPEVTSGLLVAPVPFKCAITPRSAAAEKLIRESQ